MRSKTLLRFPASNEMEAYKSTLGLITYYLICPHNALVSHLKLVELFVDINSVSRFRLLYFV